MQWYDNPAIQSAVAPILLAFLVMLALLRHRTWSEPVATLACFLLATYLIMGIGLIPLDSTRKVVLIAILFFLLGLAFFILKLRNSLLLPISVIFGSAASYWVIWPWLMRQEWLLLIMTMIACASFIIANCAGFAKATNSRKKFLALSAIFALSLSVSSIIGASAKIGQLSMALAMPFFVAFALDWIRPFQQSNMNFLFSAFCIPISLLAISSSIYAEVPWYVLIALALIPVSSFFNLPNSLDKRYKMAAEIAVAVVPGILAVLLTWNSAGSVPF